MKFCSILPVKNSDMMFKQDCVMLLAHLSAKYPEYVEYAKNFKGYKIMDNSVIELGSAFSMESLVNEALKCEVDEIILPDSFQNGQETIWKVQESIEWLKEHNLLKRFKLMAVCHGKNMRELLYTFNELNKIPEIDVIGIPKVLATWMGSRIGFAKLVKELSGKDIHLLGCWYTLEEYRGFDLSFIRSTDTCLPALLSAYGMNTWDWRGDKKIDLEKDEIDADLYNKIIKEFYENCNF